MSGLCGWLVSGNQKSDDPEQLARMTAALSRFDGSVPQMLHSPQAALAVSDLERDSRAGEWDGAYLAHVGRLRVAEPRLARRVEAEGLIPALVAELREHGARALEGLEGEFALAFLDVARGEALLAVDRMGVHPLIYAQCPGGLVFASSARALCAHPGVGAEIDPQALYDYAYFHMIPGPRTVYRGQRRLMPGEYVSLRGGWLETGRYWRMRFVEDERRDFQTLKAGFREALQNAVRDAAANRSVGCFLSGGTDSSTIAGMLGAATGEPARSFSIGFDAQGYDEMEYARIAARHFGTRHREYYVTPQDVADAIPRIAAVCDQPFGNSSAVPAFYCARLARDEGIELLLGGDGGDELFGGNERYATQQVYALYERLPAPVRKGLIEPSLAALAPFESVPVLRKARAYVRHATVPMPQRYEIYNLLERLGAQNVFTAEFLESVDAAEPRRLLDETYDDALAGTLINRMLALDLRFTLADNDLPKVTRACELGGVAVAFPMLDDRVVEFSARLAPGLKLRGTRLRYFFKEALRDFLPPEIITKQKHGFGLPFGMWVQTHAPLRQVVEGSLEGLASRGIVRPEFLAQLSGPLVASHGAYYGTMAWVLMMLEQWFRHR